MGTELAASYGCRRLHPSRVLRAKPRPLGVDFYSTAQVFQGMKPIILCKSYAKKDDVCGIGSADFLRKLKIL